MSRNKIGYDRRVRLTKKRRKEKLKKRNKAKK